jgi:hypothetical protein
VVLLLNLRDYIQYIKDHKRPSERTLLEYGKTLDRLGISEVDTENVEVTYKALLDKLENNEASYADIERFLAMLSAWRKKKTDVPLAKGITYNTLYDELKKRHGIREPYSDEQVFKILDACYSIDDGGNTLRLAMLGFYAGLRVSGANGIRWDSVKPVDGTNCVTFRVKSKGVEFNGILSSTIFNFMRDKTHYDHPDNRTPFIVRPFDSQKTKFGIGYSQKLARALVRKYPADYVELRAGHSLWHSLRKAYARKLAMSGLSSESIGLLMAHSPVNTAYRHYIYPDPKNQPVSLVQRMARDYEKTELAKLTIGVI